MSRKSKIIYYETIWQLKIVKKSTFVNFCLFCSIIVENFIV